MMNNGDNSEVNEALESEQSMNSNSHFSREYVDFKSRRLVFSISDDQKILDWIVKNQAFHLLQGNVIWKRMEDVIFGNERTWESLKDRFLTHISRHLNMYKLSRSNIWRVEKGLGILEAKTMFCDTDMEEESSVVSDTIVKQKIFRKRINLNKSTSSTENGVDEKTKRKSKHSRYDSSILPNSVSKNKSNENIELGASDSGIIKPDKFVKDTNSFEVSNIQHQNEPSLQSYENNNSNNQDKSFTADAIDRGVSEDRLRQDSDIMEEEELEPLDDSCRRVQESSLDNDVSEVEIPQELDINCTRNSPNVDNTLQDKDEEIILNISNGPRTLLDNSTSRNEESNLMVNLEASIEYGENNEAILVVRGLSSEVVLKKLEIAQVNDVKRYNLHLENEGNEVTVERKIGKYWNFVQEPMRDKEVTDLAGIGLVLGKQLKRKGFDKAFRVFGKFLLLKKNKESFVDWIRENTKANLKQAGDCYQCLYVWCEEFL